MSMIVIPPAGMSYPQARMLIENPALAHMWLCHGQHTSCPDGCDCEADPQRAKLYSDIRTHFTDADVGAYRRGYEDAARGRPCLFRNVRGQLVADCGDEWSEDMSENWTEDMRQAYIDGFNAGY